MTAAEPPHPRVAIVMPCYNAERHLRVSLDSALAQTYSNKEIVVVDDGSKDGSAAILESYAGAITVIRQPNRGAPSARNRAVLDVRAAYYMLLDSDDVLYPDCLESRMAIMLRHEGIGMVSGYSHVIDDGGRLLEGRSLAPVCSEDVVPDDQAWLFQWGTTSGWLISREAFETVGLFDPILRLVDDFDFQLRVLRRFRIGYCPTPGLQYRISEGSLSKNIAAMIDYSLMVRRKEVVYGGTVPSARRRLWVGMYYALATNLDDAIRGKRGSARYGAMWALCRKRPIAIPEALRRTAIDALKALGVRRGKGSAG